MRSEGFFTVLGTPAGWPNATGPRAVAPAIGFDRSGVPASRIRTCRPRNRGRQVRMRLAGTPDRSKPIAGATARGPVALGHPAGVPSTVKKPSDLIYGIEERPSLSVAIVIALQH